MSSNLTEKPCFVDCCRNDVDASRGLLLVVAVDGNFPRTGVKDDGVAAERRCSIRLETLLEMLCFFLRCLFI